MKKIFFLTALFSASVVSAQHFNDVTVDKVLGSHTFENSEAWKSFDSYKCTFDNALGGDQSFSFSTEWGGACVNGDQSALINNEGANCMQIHWGGIAVVQGFSLEPTQIYQIEAMIHPAGGKDPANWNNWTALRLGIFDNSDLWQENGIQLRWMSAMEGNNPNSFYWETWTGEAGEYINGMVVDYNADPSQYFVNGTSAAYWLPVKIIFSGEGSSKNPFKIDFYLNDKFLGSETMDNILWWGDMMMGFSRNGDDTDAGKVDNIRISTLKSLSSVIPDGTISDNFSLRQSAEAICLMSKNGVGRYSIFSVSGSLISTATIENEVTEISGLQAGVYILKACDESGSTNVFRAIVK